MPEIQIPSFVTAGLQVILAFIGAFVIALWVSMIIWAFKDARSRSRDIFAIILATLMVIVFGPLGLLLYILLRPPTTLAELYERSLEEEALLQDLEERPRCPGCSRQVKEEWIVCPDCHTSMKHICQKCQQPLNLTWSICPYCATPVAPSTGGHTHTDFAQPVQQEVESVVDPSIYAPPASPAEQSIPESDNQVQQETKPVAIPPHDPTTPPPSDETRPQVPEPDPV